MNSVSLNSKKCSKCGFNMTDNHCIKCGYIEGVSIIDIDKYDNSITSKELVLGDSYQKVLHNENSLNIFLMGPLYFCYRKFILLGTLLFLLDLFIRYKVSTADLSFFSLGLIQETPPVIFVWFILRIIGIPFLDIIVLKLCKIKFNIVKKMMPIQYQEFLLRNSKSSLLIVVVYFVIECLLWYYVF